MFDVSCTVQVCVTRATIWETMRKYFISMNNISQVFPVTGDLAIDSTSCRTSFQNQNKLWPSTLLNGSCFWMTCDVISRWIINNVCENIKIFKNMLNFWLSIWKYCKVREAILFEVRVVMFLRVPLSKLFFSSFSVVLWLNVCCATLSRNSSASNRFFFS